MKQNLVNSLVIAALIITMGLMLIKMRDLEKRINVTEKLLILTTPDAPYR